VVVLIPVVIFRSSYGLIAFDNYGAAFPIVLAEFPIGLFEPLVDLRPARRHECLVLNYQPSSCRAQVKDCPKQTRRYDDLPGYR